MKNKGGKKSSKGMVISKTKRANHLKHKKSYKAGNRNQQLVNPNKLPKSRLNASKNKDDTKETSNPKSSKFEKKSTSSIPSFGKKKVKTTNAKQSAKQTPEIPEMNFEANEMMDMMEQDDLDFITAQATLKSSIMQEGKTKGRKRRRNDSEEKEEIEDQYDEELQKQQETVKKTRSLLPIKTKQGIVERSIEVEYKSDEEEQEPEGEAVEEEAPPSSVAEMYARRKQKIDDLKSQIGSSSSAILENPEECMDSLSKLLKIYQQLTPDIYITGFKLISVSLVELFKDLTPGFEIKDTTNPGDKLKKETREIYGKEARLLKYYQMFLKKLEDSFACLKESKKNKEVEESQKRVAIFGVKCMCDLIISLPHFNFAKNIVHALIPFTAHKMDEVRHLVCSSLKSVFKEDKKGEISLHAVRQVNHLVKMKRHGVPSDCIGMFLALRIKDVNLDQEREDEISRYKTLTRKEKILIMSKNERRRKKKIERLEKEIVVARAEQHKGSKLKFQTETVKLVFTIYFRILKFAPKSDLMGAVLQGLAKFAHTINVEFFSDLVGVFNNLIANEQLDHRQCLFAIQVVLIMLSGQGEALNIDPLHFYAHLYKTILQLTAGPSNGDVPIAIDCLENMLIKRRKKVSIHRVLAFTKRILTLALQVQHNSSVALLSLTRTLMMTHRQTDILLDLDTTTGSGTFLAELEEPEHCNAGSTALWELHALARHYHPTVCKFARHILHKSPSTGNGALQPDLVRKSPFELHSQYDPSLLAFNPAVPAPASTPINWRKLGPKELHSSELETQISKVLSVNYERQWEHSIKLKK